MTETDGKALLSAWLDAGQKGAGKRLAQRLDVSRALISQWCHGYCRPSEVYRRALEKVAKIPFEAWETSEERSTRESLEALTGDDIPGAA